MIPAKSDTSFNTTISENRVAAIVEWFDQHKESFYSIGLTYMKNQQQMEELFFQSILKVNKEWSRYKRETSFDMWVTAIFLYVCRELSKTGSLPASDKKDSRQNVFVALNQLQESEKEAIVLKVIKGFSEEESALLLKISVDKLKKLLFSGISSLRNEMGYGQTFNGCKEYHKDYLDYLGRAMDRSKKVEFEIHIFHCQNCQEDLATFQEVMLTLVNLPKNPDGPLVPSDFMENVKNRLAEKEEQRQEKIKKRKKIGIVSAAMFVFFIGLGYFTGIFTNLYYTWTEEDPQLRAFLQEDLGDRLNLEDENNGVKIKIKSVIADDVQTLVFYEIEDTNEENQYMVDYNDGVYVENAYEIMTLDNYPRYYPPDLEAELNNIEQNVYSGKISLQPLTKETGTIQLQIKRLQKLIRDPSNQSQSMVYENMELKEGEWNFEIPVTKHPSTEYVLDEETKVEGVPVRFDKLTIAPTATILQYSINHEHPEKRIEMVNFEDLEVDHKKLEVDPYGSSFINSQLDINWIAFEARFDPLFEENPKEINIQFDSVYLTVDDQKTVELDVTQEYPQTFEYAGSTISIDKVEIGQPSNVVISNHEVKNREYESLQFHIFSEDDNEMNSMNMDIEGVLVDKHGKEYDMKVAPYTYEEIEQPRHFFTVQTIGLRSNNGEEVIPKSLEIYGYNTTKYLDDGVKINLRDKGTGTLSQEKTEH